MITWIERQLHLLDFTLSSLWRRKGKNLSLLCVYAAMVFMIGSVIFFGTSLRREAEEILSDAPAMVVQRIIAGRHDLIPLSYVESIGQIRGITSVTPRLWGYYYHPASGSNYTIMTSDRHTGAEDTITVGQGVLRTWEAARDQSFYFRAYDGEPVVLKVSGTFDGETELVSADMILMSGSSFRRITGIPDGFATDLAVEIRNPLECQTIAEKITILLPDTRPILKEEMLRTYGSMLDWRSGYIIVLLSGAVLAFLIFSWDKATGLSSEEKAEIGILKSLGWETSEVLMIKFWEGAVVSFSAFLLGVIGAYLHVFWASAPLFEHALKGWAVLYPRFRLEPTFGFYQLAVLFFFTVIPYALVTMIPAWKASVTDPDTMMRQG